MSCIDNLVNYDGASMCGDTFRDFKSVDAVGSQVILMDYETLNRKLTEENISLGNIATGITSSHVTTGSGLGNALSLSNQDLDFVSLIVNNETSIVKVDSLDNIQVGFTASPRAVDERARFNHTLTFNTGSIADDATALIKALSVTKVVALVKQMDVQANSTADDAATVYTVLGYENGLKATEIKRDYAEIELGNTYSITLSSDAMSPLETRVPMKAHTYMTQAAFEAIDVDSDTILDADEYGPSQVTI